MKTDAITSNITDLTVKRQSHSAKFTKILDGRKQAIRGLWIRNGRFYAQLKIENIMTGIRKTKRVPLLDKDGTPVATVAKAVEELNRLKMKRADNTLPNLSRTPKFSDYAATYLAYIKAGKGMKKPRTVMHEEYKLNLWLARIGELRLDKIKPAHISAFIKDRLEAGISKRTVLLDVISLRNVLKHARDIDQHVQNLPIPPGLNNQLRTPKVKRRLFTHPDLEQLCAAAFDSRTNGKNNVVPVTKNAAQFADYVRLLAYCGAREREALTLTWDDVDFDREQLTIGAAGDTKNSSARVVDFNPKLKAHLLDMKTRRAPDVDWLFPSPQRGEKDIHALSFRESLKLVREKAQMTHIAFHDLRHYFISYCVMAGIDYMTIAKWVGHRDGGILIGKVYGHLADGHAKAQAQRVNFSPAALEKEGN